MNIDNLKQSIAPYRGIIRFMLVLIVANFVWKLTIVGDEGSNAVTFFGYDISVPFIWMSAHIASSSGRGLPSSSTGSPGLSTILPH